MFQGVLRYTFDLKPQPCLAQSCTISPDGLSDTFVLQDKVFWHDGTPFSVADVVFTASKVGIEVVVENTDTGGWYRRNANWEFELCFNFLGQFMDPAIGVARAYLTSNILKGVLASNVEG